ncbi:hypothetical protein HYDPIDRAFT_24992 [Hydnomerulius pinastri MD-312]|nr:hypothetical protein HYDPIDRAFT_24992 [Hydnomerulius pinastri MD-312]
MTSTTPTHSIHALVRLLKSPSDPPSDPGPSKLSIARSAHSDPSFRAINKGEVIGEWVLAQLALAGKGRKDTHTAPNPIADPEYWCLLRDVVTSAPQPVSAARPLKSWLVPLLNRTPLANIVVELLSLSSSSSSESGVCAPARAALTVLWPLAEKKMGVEALGECLGAVLGVCGEWREGGEDLAWICVYVVGSYRDALTNAGNKKKLYTTFLATHLQPWLRALSPPSSLQHHSPTAAPTLPKPLRDALYAAGTDTLFSLDALKQPLPPLFDALSSFPSPSPTLRLLPRLYASLLSSTHKYRSALFPTSSSRTGASGGREEVRKRGMEVFGRCWGLVGGGTDGREEVEERKDLGAGKDAWGALVGLLEIVERERLFVANSVFGGGEGGEGERVLVEVRERAIGVVESAGAVVGEDAAEVVALSIQVIDVLVRIEYDLVGGVLGRVLAALMNIPTHLTSSTSTATSSLLTHLLEYHTKTRTVHTYALALLRAAGAQPPPHSISTHSSHRNSHRNSEASASEPFPLPTHLPHLFRALRAFLTPAQSTSLGPSVFGVLQSAWDAYRCALGHGGDEGAREGKRRKVGGDVMDVDADVGAAETDEEKEGASPLALALAFSHTARIAGTILSSLPAHAYVSSGGGEGEVWEEAGKLGWGVFWGCLRPSEGEDSRGQAAGKENKKKKKRTRTPSSPSTHATDTITSASLRFLYDLRARLGAPLGHVDKLTEVDVGLLLGVVAEEGRGAGLVLEIIRTLLAHISHTHPPQTQSILTATLTLLTVHFSPSSSWSGVSSALTRDNLGLAVLGVVVERWIDVFDALASKENLERLVALLLSIPLELPSQEKEGASPREDDQPIQRRPQSAITITPRDILLNVLRNAQFWELRNIRAVFLSSISNLTAPLSSYILPAHPLPSSSESPAPENLARASKVYTLLLYVPPEYFTRSVRAELVRRAVGGDIGVCGVLRGSKGRTKENEKTGSKSKKARRKSESRPDGDDMGMEAPTQDGQEDWTRHLTFLRVFLQRMGQFVNVSDHVTSRAFIEHLLNPPSTLSLPTDTLKNVTLDLIELHATFVALLPPPPAALLRSQDPDAASSTSKVIATLADTKPFSQPVSQETWMHSLVQCAVLRLIERLRDDFSLASLSEEVVRSLRALHGTLVSALLPHVNAFVEKRATGVEELPSSGRIKAWSRVLSFTQWLGDKVDSQAAPFGLKLAETMLRARDPSGRAETETCSSVLALLFEELRCIPDLSHSTHLDVVAAFYAVYAERTLDVHIAQASKKLSVEDFSHLLSVLAEGIGGSGLQSNQQERLINLSAVLLHDAPQGTLKVVQNFATRCFNLFNGHVGMYGGSSELQAHCLEFITKHCSDRPAAIRSIDLGSIWSLLSKILSGSSEHDTKTTFSIFHHIISIISALIRLRRDLVVHNLPHLGFVLRQLMMITRSLRPQLGAKQSKLVTDTFPSWISASQPLAADEGRALARLLTALTSKTVPRTHTHTHSSTTDAPKSESLAKPFSKHAGYVLTAYIDALNDPLCAMTAEMRRELEPGLFALCEMLGEHSRDAIMVSALDSGGKSIMKALWKEYEKQRYVGKG